MRAVARIEWPAVVLLVLLLAAWEIVPQLTGSRDFPPLSRVAASLAANAPALAVELVHTFRRALLGFAIALVTMVPLGVLIARVRPLAFVLEPLIDLLRPLPPLALVPIVMLFAGVGDAAKISVIAYAAAFPLLIHAIDGVRGIHPMFHTVSRSLRLTRAEQVMLVDLPAALPVIFTGIRIAITFALLVAVTSEMLLSTNGIGWFIHQSQERFRVADGIAGILVTAVVGWLLNRSLLGLEGRLLRWHHAVTGKTHG